MSGRDLRDLVLTTRHDERQPRTGNNESTAVVVRAPHSHVTHTTTLALKYISLLSDDINKYNQFVLDIDVDNTANKYMKRSNDTKLTIRLMVMTMGLSRLSAGVSRCAACRRGRAGPGAPPPSAASP